MESFKKAIIFDAGVLITFSMNGILGKLKDLKNIFDGEFIITDEVKYEVVDKPINIKRFEFEALNVKRLLDDKVIKTPKDLGISKSEIDKRTEKVLSISNNTFFEKGKPIKIIHNGEASSLALSSILNELKIKNVIAVDERTARMLGEKPENLTKLFQDKFHTQITAKKENFNEFKNFQFIRSSELIYIAFKKGFFDLKDHDTVLDALLYAVKYKGCSISHEEIEEIKKISKSR